MEQETIWIIAIVALAVGVLIGFLMGKSGSSETQRKTLEEELNGSRAEMDRYKKEVTTHFEQTASLVNELTEQYRKVHQHLATGAQNLCPDQAAGRSLQSSLQPKLENSVSESTSEKSTHSDKITSETRPTEDVKTEPKELNEKPSNADTEESKKDSEKESVTEDNQGDREADIEPPKDWAPKKPDDPGTLSDSYGLSKKAEDIPNPPHPDPGLNEDEPEKNDPDKKAKQ